MDPLIDLQPSTSPAKYLNALVITLSVVAQFTGVFDLLALSTETVFADALPEVWTLITCQLFETNLLFLLLQLLVINYFIGVVDQLWTHGQFAALVLW